MVYTIREIAPRDNRDVESVIRSCLIEFGWNREGTAWCDPDLGRFSEVYNREGFRYWVVADGTDRAVGGAGIGGLTDRVCELQKMYCLPQVRGTGAARELMALCLAYAGQYYKQCYIETRHNMTAANRFYQKWGFRRLDRPLLDTGHFSCDVWYIKDLEETVCCG